VIAAFARADAPGQVVAHARWVGPRVELEAEDADVRAAVARVFRPVPVLIDDPSLRTAGTRGAVQLFPGSFRWFLAAARTRSEAEGLKVSFVPSGKGAGGWDPAGAYRTFGTQVERLERDGAPL